MRQIRKYVSAESSQPCPQLHFGRTATIDGVKFWIWGFVDSSGRTCFVDVSSDGHEDLIGMGSGDRLTVPQYVALRYAQFWKK